MAVVRDRLELFYSISCEWTLTDQRMLGAIGLEYEVAETAFGDLIQLYDRYMDSKLEEWTPPRHEIPRAASAARVFVDHATRLQRMIGRFYAAKSEIAAAAEQFRDTNRALFDLRNALHHQDERIEKGETFALKQPTFGDLSWLVWTESSDLDLFWMAFGPVVGDEFASPAFGAEMVKRRGLNEIIYRAFDHEARLIAAFVSLSEFIQKTHDQILRGFERDLTSLGIQRGGPEDRRRPAEPAGRLRVTGLVEASKDA